MLFNSVNFLLFFPMVVLICFILPKQVRHFWLLLASYYFYMCWNAKYVLLLLFSTCITYISGRVLGRINSHAETQQSIRMKKTVVFGSLLLNLGLLFWFKYINFTISCLVKIFSVVNVEITLPSFDIVLPVGISFFTFQALSYTMDVYRGDIYPEKNFFKYALFVSFFPQLVAGPIERSKHLLKQLSVPNVFDFNRALNGFLLMLWGFFLKIVLADRIAIFVDTIYENYEKYPGAYLLIATILFALQIYCDFAGYSTIAIGASEILGISLMENFDAPYLSTSVGQFWRRWHISLTSWFKDYLYIPLGGNRKSKIGGYINLLVVFLLTGIWHGAAWTFIIWGLLNGILRILEKGLHEKVIQISIQS